MSNINIRFPNAPSKYDQPDQDQFRRAVERALQQGVPLGTTGGGAGVLQIKLDDVNFAGSVGVLDFVDADFNLTHSPAGELNIGLDGSVSRVGHTHVKGDLPAAIAYEDEANTFALTQAFTLAAAFNAAGAPFTVVGTTLVANLNADLLDGQHGAFYQNADNLNAGTVARARLPSQIAYEDEANTFSLLQTISAGGLLTTGSATLRLADPADVTLASTGHAFQIGANATTNLAMDGNEIMARNNGAIATLTINSDGGVVQIAVSQAAGALAGQFTIGGGSGSIVAVRSDVSAGGTRETFDPEIVNSAAGGASGGVMRFRRARGTGFAGSRAAVQSGDELVSLVGQGFGATAYFNGGFIQIQAQETFTDTAQGAAIIFGTTPIGGVGAVNRWSIQPDGDLVANTDNAWDVGQSGSLRPRTGYFATSVVTPALYSPAATALNLGDALTNRWQIAVGGHLIALTDNANDIGTSGATRPRNGFFGTSVVVGTDTTLSNQNLGQVTNNATLQLAGGTAGGSGNIILFGGTHATTPNEIRFRQGTNVVWSVATSTGFFLPGVDNTYDIGSASFRVRSLRLGSQLLMGDTTTGLTVGAEGTTYIFRDRSLADAWWFGLQRYAAGAATVEVFGGAGASGLSHFNVHGDLSIGTLGRFDSLDTPTEGQILIYKAGATNRWQAESLNAVWGDTDFKAAILPDGAATYIFFDPGAGADSPAGAPPDPAIPVVTQDHGTHTVEVRGYTKPADFRWFEFQYSKNAGGAWLGLANTTSAKVVHARLPFDGTAFRYRVRVTDRAGNSSAFATNTTDYTPIRTGDTHAFGAIIAGEIAVANLAAITADIGVITAGIVRNTGNTVGLNLGGAGGIPGSWTAGINFEVAAGTGSMTRYLNFTATGSNPFLKHELLSLNADGTASFKGLLDITNAPLSFGIGGAFVVLRDSDVAHGMTDAVPTDVLGAIIAGDALAGGMDIAGFADNTVSALRLEAYNVGASGSTGVMHFIVGKKSGTTVAALATSDVAYDFRNLGTGILRMFGDGLVLIDQQAGSSLEINQLVTTTRRALGIFHGRLDSGSTESVLIDAEWNTAGTPTVLKMTVTDTASAAASLLVDFQVASASKFSVGKSGDVSMTGFLEQTEIAAPGTPAANKTRLYAKDKSGVSELFYKNDAGTERDLSLGLKLIDTQTFTANGTWTKPAGAVLVIVHVVGSGGGGGGGRGGSVGTVRQGGGGGGGGAQVQQILLASDLGATESVTVGAGGAAGSGGSGADGTDGGRGVSGGVSAFGSWVKAYGGSGGGLGSTGTARSGGGGGGALGQPALNGSTANAVGGLPHPSLNTIFQDGGFGGATSEVGANGHASMWGGGSGGGSEATANNTHGGGSSAYGGGAGGAGGGVTAANVAQVGGSGGDNDGGSDALDSGGGGAGGSSGGGVGANGGAGNNYRSGQGGGGGGGNTSGNGGAGGAAGIPGGGGGGGGGGTTVGGSGAAGARGEVRVYTYA